MKLKLMYPSEAWQLGFRLRNRALDLRQHYRAYAVDCVRSFVRGLRGRGHGR